MTKREEREICEFINDALEMRHLLNCVPHDPDLTPQDRAECLAYKSFSDACMRVAYTLRRAIWREWGKQRKEERKRAAKQRRQAKRDAQKKAPKRTR